MSDDEVIYPSADIVARAIIEAAKIWHVDPEYVIPPKQKGANFARARFYAAYALRMAFPRCSDLALSRMFGAYETMMTNANEARRKSDWWDAMAVDRIRAAIDPSYIPNHLRAASAAKSNPQRRIIDRRPAAGVMQIPGDPPPGRSALDQRQREMSDGASRGSE